MSSDKQLSIKDIFNVDRMMPRIPEERSDRESRKKRESSKIKNNSWEKVTSSKSIDIDATDLRTCVPSRSNVESGENNYGGTGILTSDKTSKIDFSDTIIKESKIRKENRENRHKRSAESRLEWETVNKARTTSDVPAGNMGFTPNRSNFSVKDIPTVKIDFIESQKRAKTQNKIAEYQSLKMQNDLNAILSATVKERVSDDWSWEKEAESDLHAKLNKSHKNDTDIKLAEEKINVKVAQSPVNALNGLFDINIPQYKEPNIKRSQELKQVRKKRQDDRSWEKIEVKKYKNF